MKITKSMIKYGLDNGVIEIVDDAEPMGCLGIACKIGTSAFYFAKNEGEAETTAEEYLRTVPQENIVGEIYSALDSFYNEYDEDEYRYYYLTLIEKMREEIREKYHPFDTSDAEVIDFFENRMNQKEQAPTDYVFSVADVIESLRELENGDLLKDVSSDLQSFYMIGAYYLASQLTGWSVDRLGEYVLRRNQRMKTYRVIAKFSHYAYIDIEAESAEEAEQLAEDADGVEFTPTSDDGDFCIERKETREVG